MVFELIGSTGFILFGIPVFRSVRIRWNINC